MNKKNREKIIYLLFEHILFAYRIANVRKPIRDMQEKNTSLRVELLSRRGYFLSRLVDLLSRVLP